MTSITIPVLERLRASERARKPMTTHHLSGAWHPAPFVVHALLQVLEEGAGRCALDPWSTSGIVLTAAVEAGLAGHGVGLCRQGYEQEVMEAVARGLPIEWLPSFVWPMSDLHLGPEALLAPVGN